MATLLALLMLRSFKTLGSTSLVAATGASLNWVSVEPEVFVASGQIAGESEADCCISTSLPNLAYLGSFCLGQQVNKGAAALLSQSYLDFGAVGINTDVMSLEELDE